MHIFCGIYTLLSESTKADINAIKLVIPNYLSQSIAEKQIDGHAFIQSNKNNLANKEAELPFHDSERQLTIIGNILLHNRVELLAKLGLKRLIDTSFSDAELILAAYENWGENCVDHLLGNFAFAIWNSKKQRLFCCTDHFSMHSICYYFDGNKFIFASSPILIHAIKTVKTGFNTNKLINWIDPELNFLFREETWYQNIHYIPAGSAVGISNNTIYKRKYWTPAIGQNLSFKNDVAYQEALQDLLFRVISDHLKSDKPVTALLSGGLDSSTIVSIAAKILEKQNKQLDVFSVVLPDNADPLLKDEKYFIDQYKSVPNVNINYITAPNKGFFSHLEELHTSIDAPNLSSRHFLYRAFEAKALELGSDVILDGAGGELGLTNYATGGYAELFLNLQWFGLGKELYQRKALTGETIWSNVRSQVIKPLLPHFFTKKLSATYSSSTKIFLQKNFEKVLSKEFTKDINSHTIKKLSTNHKVNQLNTLLKKQLKGSRSSGFAQTEFRLPLMDKRLLDFSLNIPLNYKIRNGYNRYMVRAGLDGILPKEIQWRNSKAPFSPDYNVRFNQQQQEVKNFLNSIAKNDPIHEIINVDQLKIWANFNVPNQLIGDSIENIVRDSLPQAIILINFLRRFKEFQI